MVSLISLSASDYFSLVYLFLHYLAVLVPGTKRGLSLTGEVGVKTGGQKRSGRGKKVAGETFFHIISLPVYKTIVWENIALKEWYQTKMVVLQHVL